MLKFEFDTKNLEKVIKYFGNKAAGAINPALRRALKISGQIMLKSVDKNFRVSGRPRWPALSAATVANRRKKGRGAKPLMDTGRLRGSITARVDGDSVKIGTNLRYARIHQFGGSQFKPEMKPKNKKALSWINPTTGKRVFARKTKAHWVKIPKRAYLLYQKEDLELISKVFAKEVGTAFDKGFEAKEAE